MAMDRNALEALTFSLAAQALAESRGLTPSLGDRLEVQATDEADPASPGHQLDRLCAVLVQAAEGGELPPDLVATLRERLAGSRHLLAIATGDPAGGEAAPAPEGESFRGFLEGWRFERIFSPVPQLAACGRAVVELVLPTDEALIPGLSHLVGLLLREFGYPRDEWMSTIPLVIDEVLTNAMRHGNGGCRDKRVTVRVEVSAGELVLSVTDEGPGFARENVADPRQGDRVWRAGGRGLFLIESLMDGVEYRDAGRTCRLVKRKGPTTETAPAGAPSPAPSR